MAITFVNDLRLSEMATGDNSGTWGNVTNTNLELIGEALGYGTEGITTNADTHTSTIADGSTDPVRALYVEYTGTLDSACTITIAPNTVSKVCFIENGTSGSQNIIIKQGSGATVTIPAGDTKAVYLDGAGSGAKVVDAFASLSVVDLKVQDDLTVTDDVAIGGLATVGGTLAVTGVVTANAGVVVDTMTLDASTLTATGDFIIDAAADITLDAGGGDWRYKDDGTTIATWSNVSGTYQVKVNTQDADFKIVGDDGGAEITALTLDMSQAGRATFNEGIVAGTSSAGAFGLTLNTISGDNMALSVADTGSAGAAHGTISVSDGDLILDVAGSDILLNKGGTTFGSFRENSSNFRIQSDVADKDMLFLGNDGGVGITALTLDMSAAGEATFNSNVGIGAVPSGHRLRVTGGTSYFLDNVFIAGGSSKMISSDSASNPLIFGLNGSEKMRLDGFGLMIGTTTEGQNQADNFTVSDSGNMGMTLRSTDSNECSIFFSDATSGAGEYAGSVQYSHSSDALLFGSAGVTRMRLDSSGNLNINHATNTIGASSGTLMVNFAGNAANGIKIRDSRGESGTNNAIVFVRGDSEAGAITTTTAPATQYTTASDERLKENIADADDASSKIDAIKVRKFDWKGNGSHQNFGLIAQELHPIAPDAVAGDPESEKMMSIDPAKLVPMLIKEIQSLRTRITALEG